MSTHPMIVVVPSSEVIDTIDLIRHGQSALSRGIRGHLRHLHIGDFEGRLSVEILERGVSLGGRSNLWEGSIGGESFISMVEKGVESL